jgi:2-oxoacid:acceptor oxidoreductase delta subunit (pyruvate/2-ketoisovalerate family)
MSRKVCQPQGGAAQGPLARPPEERLADFAEATQGLDREAALRQASRCLASQTCTYCEVCQLLCPDLCITRDPQSGAIRIDLDHCKGCGLCAYFCPKGAIQMELER